MLGLLQPNRPGDVCAEADSTGRRGWVGTLTANGSQNPQLASYVAQ